MTSVSDESLARLRAFAHELAGMAKTGLEFVQNDYDRERYGRTLQIAEELAAMTFPDGLPRDAAYLGDIGVVTPKTGCTIAAFRDGAILLIRRADNGRWALPGGWAEINTSPSENAVRELREETGFIGEVERLLGVFDNRRFQSSNPYHFWTLLFRARIVGGAATPSTETTHVAFFGRHEIPAEASPHQRAMIECAFADAHQAVFP